MKFVEVFQFFNYLSEEMSRCNCFSTGRQGKLGMSHIGDGGGGILRERRRWKDKDVSPSPMEER